MGGTPRAGIGACALLFVAACSDGGGPADAASDAPDATLDAGTAWMPEPPAPPAPPAPPVLTPCPPGWRETTTPGGATVCDPWPAGGPARCTEIHEAHFPGEPGCSRVGTACPADGTPADLPTDVPVLHVRAGVAPGGDGSLAAPFGRIGDAVAAAPAGAVVAIAAGSYDELLVLERSVTLWGACAGGTQLTRSVPDAAALIVVGVGVEATLRNLRIGPHLAPGIEALGAVTIRDVVVASVAGAGLRVGRNASLDAERLVVRGVVRAAGVFPEASDGTGVAATGPTPDVRIRWAVFEDVTGSGAVVSGSVLLEDVAIRDVQCSPPFTGGAIVMDEAGSTSITRLAVDRTCGGGIMSFGAAAAIEASDFVVRSTRPVPGTGWEESGPGAHGSAGVLTLRRGWIHHPSGSHGVSVSGDGVAASVTVEDLVVEGEGVVIAEIAAVRAVYSESAVRAARVHVEEMPGFLVTLRGEVDVGDLTVRSSHELGFGAGACAHDSRVAVERADVNDYFAAFEGCVLSITDLQVRDGVYAQTGALSHGAMEIDDGARLELRRALIERGNGGMRARNGAQMILEDLRIEDQEGYGIGLARGSLEVRRAVIERSSGLGIWLLDDGGGTFATIADVWIRDVRGVSDAMAGRPPYSSPSVVGTLGRALAVIGPAAEASVSRAVVEQSRELGIESSAGANVVARQVRVVGTHARDCAETTCVGEPGGHGIGLYAGGRLDAAELTVEGSFLCGLHAIDPGPVALSATILRRNAIGICAQGSADVAPLIGQVAFDENGFDVQSTEFYAPAPPPGGFGE